MHIPPRRALTLSNGITLSYLEWKADSSEETTIPLLLLHGMADSISDVEALMIYLNWSSAHILAHSWSAKMAAIWARQSSAKCKSLMLIDPALIGTFPSWTKIIFPIYYKLLPSLKMLGPFENKQAAIAQTKQLKQFQGWSEHQKIVFENAVEEKSEGQWGSKFVIAARDPMVYRRHANPRFYSACRYSCTFDLHDQRNQHLTETAKSPTKRIQPSWSYVN